MRLPWFPGFLLLGWAAIAPLTALGDGPTTLRGIAQATKGGLMVQGVVIDEGLLPRGESVERFAGKKVEVQAEVATAPAEQYPPPPAPQVQHREGPYEYVKKIHSIRLIAD